MAKTWTEEIQKKLKPITKAQIKHARTISAKHIFVKDKEGNAICTCCEQNIILPKSKHLEKVECPNCKKTMTVQHSWRMSKKLRVISWTVVPKVIDNTLVLRFICADSYGESMLKISERARMIINENHSEAEYWCLCSWKSVWEKTKVSYFCTPSYISPNPYYCLEAIEYPRNFFKEINKLDCFKYYPVEKVYAKNDLVSQLHYLVRSARVNEKLANIGMQNVDTLHRHYYEYHAHRTIELDNSKTKLVDILKMDREHYNEFKKNPTFDNLTFYSTFRKTSIADCNFIIEEGLGKYGSYYYAKEYITLSKRIGVTLQKFAKYVKSQKTSTYEMKTYWANLDTLGYDKKDLSYALPKDFHKAYKRVYDELQAMYKAQREKENAERLAFEQKKEELLGAIQKKLHDMPELKEFFSGKNGFMVSCPATVEEFVNEGRNQHNCVGSMGYDDRVAQNKTLIFFIRELNNPNASFVTMEYCHGEIVQCMFDHNQRVGHDTEVYSFAEALAKTLREKEILAA